MDDLNLKPERSVIFTTEAPRFVRKDLFVCPAISRTYKKHQSFGQVLPIYTEICIRLFTLTLHDPAGGALLVRDPSDADKSPLRYDGQSSLSYSVYTCSSIA